MDRRSFLRGLFVAALAANCPALPDAQSNAFADQLTDLLLVNGERVSNVAMTPIGNGWFRMTATAKTGAGTLEFDARAMNNGRGILVVSPTYEAEPPEMHPGQLRTANLSVGCGTLSMCVKPAPVT